MKDKIALITGIGIVFAVIFTLGFYLQNAGTIEIEELFLMIIPIILVSSAVYLLYDRAKNIKAGLPAQDERSKQIGYKAAYYGFIAAIWSATGAPLLAGIVFDYELPGNYVTAVVVLVSGVSFILSYLILTYWGSVE